MYVNVNTEFDVYLSTKINRNPPAPEPVDGLEVLGDYCVYLGDKFEELDAETSEDDWVQLWDRMGLSGGDAAEVIATTLGKMPLA